MHHHLLHRSLAFLCFASALFPQTARADDAPAVTVSYTAKDTELVPLTDQTPYFRNRAYTLQEIPSALNGLPFTRRDGGRPAPLTLDVASGATVFLLLDSDRGSTNINLAHVVETNKQLAADNWERLPDAQQHPNPKKIVPIAIYRRTFSTAQSITLPATGFSGIDVAAEHILLSGAKDAPADPSVATTAGTGDYAPIARRQTSIKSLYITHTPSGMLGHTMDYILTATPGLPGKTTPVTFTTAVGKDMHIVLAEALRAVCIQYPNWKATKVELSFDDKYSPKDGGSIGAATGTLFLSMLRGFEIDPAVAMTGDITVDKKIRAIGGVVAKIRGATDAHCTLVALPAENYDQVVDGMVYEGLPLISSIQVIGIPTLEDAAAVARTDRDPALTEAITTFAQVQDALKKSPSALYARETQDRLAHILTLAPNHFSAKLLLLAAQHKQPTRLSITASVYYTDLAASQVLPLIAKHAQERHVVTPTIVQSTLQKLGHVHLIGAAEVYPYITALETWIQTASDIESGKKNPKTITAATDAVTDAQAKLQSDRDAMEKTMSEGL